MRPFSKKSYASVVDVAIDRGLQQTRKVGLPYDIAFFAKAMWTAYPFMRKADTETDVKSQVGRLSIDFMTAVQCGSEAVVRDCLNRMRRLQRKLKFRMVEAQRYPEPKSLRTSRRKQVAKASRVVIREKKPFEQQVDEAIAKGMEQTKDTNRRHGLSRTYDTAFFVRALWRAKPFMDFALGTDPDVKAERKFRVLRLDFLLAVYDGNKGAVTGMLADMVRMGKKRHVVLPSWEELSFPIPYALQN